MPFSEQIAVLTLTLYALAAVLIVFWHYRRSGCRWQVWVLYFIERLYVPLVFHLRANRRCPYPDGPALIIANHRSPVDPLFLWQNNHLTPRGTRPMRVISFMTAREYVEQPGFIGWICRHVETIPTDRHGRDMGPAREALRKTRQGYWVGIFPEGRINTGPGLLPASPGVAWLALRAEVPVYPVWIHDAPQTGGMVRPFCTFSRVRITYGDPIDLSEYSDRKKTQDVLAEVTELLMSRLLALSHEPQETADEQAAEHGALLVRPLAG